jgi:arylsulfatase A-like enzyme
VAERPNVLIILLDDVGIDKLNPWSAAADAPLTPQIDRLVAEGLVFRNAYAAPVCQAARAALLTGRWARRTGVGANSNPGSAGWVLAEEEGTIAHVLAHAGYATALVGKWHMSTYATPSPLADPNRRGFTWWRGTFANLYDQVDTPEIAGDYLSWEKIADGEPYAESRYATTVQVDDALDLVGRLTEPWLLWWAPNAAHDPFHPPPDSLLPNDAAKGTPDAYHAVIQALDLELGRLRAGIGEERLDRTWVVLMADNGTPSKVITPPYNSKRGKTTSYDGGSHVPLLWRGPGVAVGETSALVHAIDLLPTLADALDLDPSWSPYGPQVVDGVSYLPVLSDPAKPGRSVLFTEDFAPNGDPAAAASDHVAARDARWRLLVDILGGQEQFYEYVPGAVDEGPDLIPGGLDEEQEAARARLRADVSEFAASIRWSGP